VLEKLQQLVGAARRASVHFFALQQGGQIQGNFGYDCNVGQRGTQSCSIAKRSTSFPGPHCGNGTAVASQMLAETLKFETGLSGTGAAKRTCCKLTSSRSVLVPDSIRETGDGQNL
jgi:hypothetical protein